MLRALVGSYGLERLYYMYMPTTEKEKPASQLMHIVIDGPLLKRLDDFRFKNRLESRSEAVRCLMKLALDQKLTPKAAEKGN
jgi:hypothetical protein